MEYLNKYIIIDTESCLHKKGFVSESYKTLEEANKQCIYMLEKNGPRKIYIAEIISHNRDICEYKMYDLENNPDFNILDVSQINNQLKFDKALYDSMLKNKESEFFTNMLEYYNTNKCFDFLCYFTENCCFSGINCYKIINILANNIEFLFIIDDYNIHKTNDIVDKIINICLELPYLNEEFYHNFIKSFLFFLNKLHTYNCLGYDKYIEKIEKQLCIKKCKIYKKHINKIKKDYHVIYTDNALLNGDPLPSNWKIYI